MSQKAYEEYPHHLDNSKNIKLIKAIRSLTKSEEKLIKARALRIWIENNPKINLITYPYYRIKERKMIKEIQGGE